MPPKRVVVVGGGVIGAASAYYLAKAGVAVTLVDKGRFGGGCSAGNCGYVCPSHALPMAAPAALVATLRTLLMRNSPLSVRPRVLLSDLGWFLRFARRCNPRDMLSAADGIHALLASSRRLYDQLLADENIACEWEARGLLFVFRTRGVFDHYADADRLLTRRFGLAAERLDADALLKLEPALLPGAAAGAYLYRGDAHLRPDKLLGAWRGVLERLGVRVVENQAATGFVREGRQAVAVSTAAGDVAGDAFVLAAGAWTPLFADALGCRPPILPGKGYSLTMPRPAVCPTYPMIFEEHRVAVTPFASGYRVGSTMEFAGYDAVTRPERLQLLRDGARLYLREPEAGLPQEAWHGWRPMTPDGKPVIDFAPRLGNVLIAAGHGMLGLSMATGTGKLVAERLTGATPHVDWRHYALGRFR